MTLHPIGQDGALPTGVTANDYLEMVVDMTVAHYKKTGFKMPWIGYLATSEVGPIGVCGFKSAPVSGRVEIAYGTMPGHEGRGVATAMASELVKIAGEEDSSLIVFAQTLPENNASTSILTKLGFRMIGPIEHDEDGTVWEWELS